MDPIINICWITKSSSFLPSFTYWFIGRNIYRPLLTRTEGHVCCEKVFVPYWLIAPQRYPCSNPQNLWIYYFIWPRGIRLQMELRFLISWPKIGKNILELSRWSSIITGVLKSERLRQKRGQSNGCGRGGTGPTVAGFEDKQRRPWAKEWWLPVPGKAKAIGSL